MSRRCYSGDPPKWSKAVVIGLAVTLALIEGTKAVLGRSDAVTGLRYFLGVLFAAGVWPMTFGWFGRLGKK